MNGSYLAHLPVPRGDTAKRVADLAKHATGNDGREALESVVFDLFELGSVEREAVLRELDEMHMITPASRETPHFELAI